MMHRLREAMEPNIDLLKGEIEAISHLIEWATEGI